ncbi:MAG: PAS domain-containing protein, partial [Nitrospira sp.]|nr:PAS domain-containing protein [Nitrospira sp.]
SFGNHCEVVLHDLRNPENLHHSIIKIVNGHVTGRTIGGSLTNQGLKQLRSKNKDDLLINYKGETPTGRKLKSSTMIFRNTEGKQIAAVCINFDYTDISNFDVIIRDIFGIPQDTTGDEPFENFSSDMDSTLNNMADDAIQKVGRLVSILRKKDKIEIVSQLDNQGFFLIKGAIKLIAMKLNVSKYTVYNYIEEARLENQSSKNALGNSLVT